MTYGAIKLKIFVLNLFSQRFLEFLRMGRAQSAPLRNSESIRALKKKRQLYIALQKMLPSWSTAWPDDITSRGISKNGNILNPPSWISCYFQNLPKPLQSNEKQLKNTKMI